MSNGKSTSQYSKQLYENLPEILQEGLHPFQGHIKDISLIGYLGSLSAVFPKIYGIYDGKVINGNLYFVIIGPPATGKTNILHGANSIRNIVSLKEIVKIAGNSSASVLYQELNAAEYGAVIVETEADTLSNSLKQEWGGFSDVLRNAFHHESCSISRKGKTSNGEKFEITNPKLSMVLAGTSNQLNPLISSVENGLFSRLTYYNVKANSKWKNVFKYREDVSIKLQPTFNRIHCIYEDLINLEKEVQFRFTSDQEDQFFNIMSNYKDEVGPNYPAEFESSIVRMGVVFFRISMILTILRKHNKITNNELVCEDVDFNIAKELIGRFLINGYEIFQIMNKVELNKPDKDFYNKLPQEFTSKEFKLLAMTTFKINQRAAYNKLNKLLLEQRIEKISQGQYKKV